MATTLSHPVKQLIEQWTQHERDALLSDGVRKRDVMCIIAMYDFLRSAHKLVDSSWLTHVFCYSYMQQFKLKQQHQITLKLINLLFNLQHRVKRVTVNPSTSSFKISEQVVTKPDREAEKNMIHCLAKVLKDANAYSDHIHKLVEGFEAFMNRKKNEHATTDATDEDRDTSPHEPDQNSCPWDVYGPSVLFLGILLNYQELVQDILKRNVQRSQLESLATVFVLCGMLDRAHVLKDMQAVGIITEDNIDEVTQCVLIGAMMGGQHARVRSILSCTTVPDEVMPLVVKYFEYAQGHSAHLIADKDADAGTEADAGTDAGAGTDAAAGTAAGTADGTAEGTAKDADKGGDGSVVVRSGGVLHQDLEDLRSQMAALWV